MDHDSDGYAEDYQLCRRFPESTRLLWLGLMQAEMPVAHDATLLDVGCGTGRFTRECSHGFNAKVIGLDPSKQMLRVARSLSKDRYVLAPAERIPLPADTADMAILSMVFHHLSDHLRAAAELGRVLRPGGVLCIRNSTREQLDRIPHPRFFPGVAQQLARLLPSTRTIIRTMGSQGLRLQKHSVVLQETASSLGHYYEKVRRRAYSPLRMISGADFERGLRNIEEIADFTQSSPVLEAVDWFVFRTEK